MELQEFFKAAKDAGMVLVSEKALIPAHGEEALLSYPGVRPSMPSAIRRSQGIKLPLFQSLNINERVEIFTAQDAASGTNATDWCASAAIAGNLRVAQIIAIWGYWKMQTNEIVAPNVGDRRDYADVNRQIINGLNVYPDNYFIPDVVRRAGNINTTLGKELIQYGNWAEQAFARVDFTGNTATASSSTIKGFIREYDGLAKLINANYSDAVSSLPADAINSDVRVYNAVIGAGLVTLMSDVYRGRKLLAELVGKPNTQWEWQINFRMWNALVDIWACNYDTARCSTSSNDAGRVDLARITQLNHEMRRGKYLLIDGEPVPVNTGAGVPVENGATTNEFESDIFLVPKFDPDSALGMVQDGVEWLTYRQFFPFTNEDIQQLMREGFTDLEFMNNGLYLVGSTYGNDSFCRSKVFAAKTRIKLDYPFLAARIDDVIFTNSTPVGTPYQDEPDYVGGGRESETDN